VKFNKTVNKKMCFVTVKVMETKKKLLPTQYDMPVPIKHYRNDNYSVSKTLHIIKELW
jgi:hypothetical protein